MKKTLILLIIFISALRLHAQTSLSSAEIYSGIKKLNVLGSVLYIAAHPDDENTRLLTYFSKDQLLRTGYLSLTRGDGGQNLIGDEQGILLGLIRTQELLAARRIDGAEQFFTRAYDFGYSKTPAETFTKWDKEKVLADVVWIIRKFRPDVIITRFPSTGEGGHGHHTASAILANEAFSAAADSLRFPDQLQYVQPWQAKRIVWNTFNFGGNNTTRDNQFHFDVGGFNPVLGKSYGEIASESRSQHKSQGFGVAKSRGEALEYFSTTGGDAPSGDLFSGVNTRWQRVDGSGQVIKLIASAIDNYDFLKPEKSVTALVHIHKALKSLPAGYWRDQKLKETEQLIIQAAGIWMEANAAVQNAVQGDSLTINVTLNNRSDVPVVFEKAVVESTMVGEKKILEPNKNFNFSKTIFVSNSKPLTQPYWLKEQMHEGLYEVDDQQLIGQPDVTPPFVAQINLIIANEPILIEKTVQYKFTDPVKGEVYQPVFVIPAMTVFANPDLLLFDKQKQQQKTATLHISANKKIQASQLEARMRSRFYALSQKKGPVTLSKNTSREYAFDIANEKMSVNEEDFVHPFADFTEEGQNKYAYLATTTINYDHIPTIRYFYSDGIRLLNINLKTAGKKIGYIEGAGDKVPEALTQMGYQVTLLSDKELSKNNLQQYDAIITGVRAYNTNEWLNGHYEQLMQYVKAGGNLIVQYNTSNNIGPVKAKIGPYNFSISRNRITDENAEVNFLQPQHPALNFPNKITEKDFKGWIQERSIYHAENLDSNFQSILSMKDPGEQPHSGSLVIAPYGKGFFTYTGVVFFRELPAGVPGAYRLLANLIALNSKKEF
jgi:LmbE family N-acetylglucosaminyl deacetylase